MLEGKIWMVCEIDVTQSQEGSGELDHEGSVGYWVDFGLYFQIINF